MSQPRVILFVVLSKSSIACGCAGQSPFAPYRNTAIEATTSPHHRHEATLWPIRSFFVALESLHHKPVRDWWRWTNPKTRLPYPRHWSP
jgi:hypothetical protein